MNAIGIDWGSSVTRIATWRGAGRPAPVTVDHADAAVPTALTYRSGGVRVGWPRHPEPDDRVVTGADMHEAVRSGAATIAGRPTDEVLAHFFGLVLQVGPHAVRHRHGAVDRVVVAVPYGWLATGAVTRRLRAVLTRRCGIAHVDVVGAPVAVMAYLAATDSSGQTSRLAHDSTPVVVCDAGESSCEVTVFRVDTDLVRPIAHGGDDTHEPFSRILDRTLLEHVTRTAPLPHPWLDGLAAVCAARRAQHAHARRLLRGSAGRREDGIGVYT
jgi:hypothetical protein